VNPEAPKVCLDCGAELHGRFCHACGQDHRHPRLTLRAVVSDAAEELFDVDSRLLRTLWGLVTRPGAVAREYVEGHRKRFLHPARYALVTAALAFAALSLLPQGSRSTDELDVLTRTVAQLQVNYWEVIQLAVLPIYAGTAWLLHFRKGRNYAEHVILAFFAFGSLFWIQTLTYPLMWIGGAGVIVRGLVIPVGYTAWVFWGFHRQHPLVAILKGAVAWFLIQSVTGGLLYAIGALLVRLDIQV
jgi:hypothetical protein